MIRFSPSNIAIFILYVLSIYILTRNNDSQDIKSFQSHNSQFVFSQTDVIIYNRIPKTGSTTFTNAIAYDLCKINNFNAIHINTTKNVNNLNLVDEAAFVRNVSTWKERKPAFYHGHLFYVDFTRFGYPNPIYINVVREPLERFVSYYYFLRYGDTYRVGLKRSRAGNNETFDECLQKNGKDCNLEKLWLQIPYFCGNHAFCKKPGNALALETAKRNLVERYLVVGQTDRIRDLITVLEKTLPNFLKDAGQHFDQLDEKRAHLRYTTKKVPPNEQTLSLVQAHPIYKMERSFYDFAVKEFNLKFQRLFDENKNFVGRQFRYEKISPN